LPLSVKVARSPSRLEFRDGLRVGGVAGPILEHDIDHHLPGAELMVGREGEDRDRLVAERR